MTKELDVYLFDQRVDIMDAVLGLASTTGLGLRAYHELVLREVLAKGMHMVAKVSLVVFVINTAADRTRSRMGCTRPAQFDGGF